jgi:hypothetical protein
MRNKNTIEFLGVWEQLHNPVFNSNEFVRIKNLENLNAHLIKEGVGHDERLFKTKRGSHLSIGFVVQHKIRRISEIIAQKSEMNWFVNVSLKS